MEADGLRNKQHAAGTGSGPWPEFGCLSSVRTGSVPSRRRLTRLAARLFFLPALMFLAAVSLSGCAAEPDAPPAATEQLGQGVPPLVATCSNGVVVPNPDENPGLVGDCVTLLEAWNTLGGKGRLGWYPMIPINEWMGVTVEGKPKRVRRLDVFGLQLIGKIPGNLGKLAALEHLDLSINELHREIPAELGGFVSRYGRTGRILSVRADDRTLEIATPSGTLHAKVGAATNIHQTTNDDSRAPTFEDLIPGTLVTVDGATGTEENYDAGDIEVVPEGEGGFDIAPATGTGPRLMPVFP